MIEVAIAGWSSDALVSGAKDFAGTMIGVMVFIIAIRSLRPKKTGTFDEAIKKSFEKLEGKYSPLFKKSVANDNANEATKNKLDKIYRYNLSTKFERLLRAGSTDDSTGKMGKFVDFEKASPIVAEFTINKSTFQKSAENSDAKFDEQKGRFGAEVAACINKQYPKFCKAISSTVGIKVKFSKEEGLDTPDDALKLAELVEYVLLLYIVEYQY